MCAIGRAFVARHPNREYSPTCDEFRLQRDVRHLHGRPFTSTRRSTRRRKPSAECDPTQDYAHTRRMGLRIGGQPGARRAIHTLMEIPPRRCRLHSLQRRAQGGAGGTGGGSEIVHKPPPPNGCPPLPRRMRRPRPRRAATKVVNLNRFGFGLIGLAS